MSKNHIHIVSTRSMDNDLKKEAMRRGFFIEDKDFLDFSYSEDENSARQLEYNNSPLIFTSQHAIRGISFLEEKFNFTFKNVTCYCIEGATSRAAIEAGFEVKDTAKNAFALAKRIIQNGESSVFHCTTNRRRHELERALNNPKIELTVCEIYDKKMVRQKVSEFEGVLFFSPSQFDAFTACNELPPDTPIFCIGDTTAEHTASLNHKNIIVSAQASEAGVLEAMYSFFKKIQ